jgi:FixJ family two-component response regulator
MSKTHQPAVKVVRPRLSRRPLPARGPPRGPEDFPVVGIGASAGGLDACKTLLGALPAGNGMAFILIQHLDPSHESMMVDLLAGHTTMTVRQATDGMPVERDHLYVIPPGTYLSVVAGVLRLSQPQARHGARLPFDFLLQSLAKDCGAKAIGVVLSGTGADGSMGIKSIKGKCGLIIAQTPAEAAFDGMSKSAIATGMVDLVLPVAEIPDALVKYDRRMTLTRTHTVAIPPDHRTLDCLLKIIELLRTKTAHDFTLYKQGTLQRRIERRMGMAAIATDDMDRYLDILQKDKLAELMQVVQRLLPTPIADTLPAAQLQKRPVNKASDPEAPIIFVVDDDRHIRESIRDVLEDDGRIVQDFATCEAFLEADRPGHAACLVIDAYLPGMSGLELLQHLNDAGVRLPAIMITGYSDAPTAVQAMKAGALDFIEKPIGGKELIACISRALELSRDATKLSAWRETAAHHVADLTPRQRQIMDMVLAGNPSKNIAADLGISQRTVENHRASIMAKTGSKSLPALARLALAATWNGTNDPRI